MSNWFGKLMTWMIGETSLISVVASVLTGLFLTLTISYTGMSILISTFGLGETVEFVKFAAATKTLTSAFTIVIIPALIIELRCIFKEWASDYRTPKPDNFLMKFLLGEKYQFLPRILTILVTGTIAQIFVFGFKLALVKPFIAASFVIVIYTAFQIRKGNRKRWESSPTDDY